MRIVFLTGIWPPDVGGPATHGPDFARFLRDRGHDVQVVTMADDEPSDLPVPVHSIARGRPFVVRYPQVALAGFRLARTADVVYATSTYAAAAAASTGARRPLVAKLVSDPAYERAWRYRRVPRLARGVRAGARSALGRAQVAADVLASARAADRRPEPVSRRDRRRLGPRCRTHRGAGQPGAAPDRRRARAARARDIRLRRPPDPPEGAAGPARSDRRGRRCQARARR